MIYYLHSSKCQYTDHVCRQVDHNEKITGDFYFLWYEWACATTKQKTPEQSAVNEALCGTEWGVGLISTGVARARGLLNNDPLQAHSHTPGVQLAADVLGMFLFWASLFYLDYVLDEWFLALAFFLVSLLRFSIKCPDPEWIMENGIMKDIRHR